MCREHVVDVRNDYARFQEAQGDVVVITMGTVDQTAAFRERNRLPFACLADPQRIAYKAFGIPRASVWQVAGPAMWAGGLKAMLRAGIGKPVGDVFQLHGTFIVDSGGVIRFLHVPKYSTDQPSNDILLDELQTLTSGHVVDAPRRS